MPTTVRRSVTVDRARADVAAYLEDFTTSAEWDPHTVSCRRLDAGPLRVGARFENVQRLLGHEATLTYEVREHDPGRRIVFAGGNETIQTTDTMEFADAASGGTTVTYTVVAQLQGRARVGTPLVAPVMNKIADDGARQLHEVLVRRVPARP